MGWGIAKLMRWAAGWRIAAILPLMLAAGTSAQLKSPGECADQACVNDLDETAHQRIAQREALLSGLTDVSDAALRDPPPGDWLWWRRTADGQGHSPLDAINRANIGRLSLAWAWALPAGPTVSTPIVHDGVLFVQGAGDRVQALDAARGDLLWEYVRDLPREGDRIRGKKSMAIAGHRLFLATEDEHLIALDIRSGKLLWDHAVAGAATASATRNSYHYSAGPIVVGDKVIAGISGCLRNQPGGCFISAHDVRTGAQAWRFDTIARPGTPAGKSWGDLPIDQRRGGSVWMAGSYDPELNLVFFGTGQATPYNALQRGTTAFPKAGKEQLLYTNSTLALDPGTGRLVWHYQHLANDSWDMDYAFERTVATIEHGGRTRKVVITIGKPGIVEILDAATGRFIAAHDMGLQDIIAAIDPKTGRKTIDPRKWPGAIDQPVSFCPGALGARNWAATSYDPKTRRLFVPMNDHCSTARVVAREPGDAYEGGAGSAYLYWPGPASGGQIGLFRAIDPATGEQRWQMRDRGAMSAGALSTAGGLVFSGTIDRHFRALDSDSGAVLWETRLATVPNALPISYAADGRQYVAVISNSSTTFANAVSAMFSDIRNPGTESAVLWVFGLDGGPRAADRPALPVASPKARPALPAPASPDIAMTPLGYAADQADRGEILYRDKCAQCHGDSLSNGEFAPPLKGAHFRTQYRGQPALKLYNNLLRMPPGMTGSLGTRGYADLLAFILRANGIAATAEPTGGEPEGLAGRSIP